MSAYNILSILFIQSIIIVHNIDFVHKANLLLPSQPQICVNPCESASEKNKRK